MKPQTLFDHFERLTDAPKAVARLRELILQLAVRGKLVPQDLRDEPAARLLERIEAERRRLVKEKRLKQTNPLSPVHPDEMPFELPSGWVWVRLGELTQASEYGTSQKASEINKGVPILRMNNIVGGSITFDNLKYLPNNIDELPRLYLKPNDLLFNRTNSYELVGKTGIFKGEDNSATFASYLIRLTLFLNHVDADFINLVMNSAYYRQTQIEPEITQQTNQANFNGTKLAKTILPLPPFEEQKRVVAKVDELMRLCDELERAQGERREARQRLSRVALDGLLAACDVAEFQARWQTASDFFPTLTAASEQIGKLRQTVLQLAVQGKLTRQDPRDEPASVLLRRIRAERERLIKEKKIKRADPLPSVNPDETPFALPSGWAWVRIGKIAEKLGAGSTPLGGKNVYQQSGVKFLRSQNVWDDGLRLENVAYISPEIHQRMSGTVVEPSDILLNITGASIGRSSLVPDDIGEANVSQHVAIIRLIDKSIRFFVHLCLVSPLVQASIMQTQVGISREGLSMRSLKDFIIPLPPLEEQKHIVAVVNRLMALCDELEAGLRRREEDGERLLRAAVRSLLAPTAEGTTAEAVASLAS